MFFFVEITRRMIGESYFPSKYKDYKCNTLIYLIDINYFRNYLYFLSLVLSDKMWWFGILLFTQFSWDYMLFVVYKNWLTVFQNFLFVGKWMIDINFNSYKGINNELVCLPSVYYEKVVFFQNITLQTQYFHNLIKV